MDVKGNVNFWHLIMSLTVQSNLKYLNSNPTATLCNNKAGDDAYHTDSLDQNPRARILLPKTKNKYGMGINATEKNANTEMPQPIPILCSIGVMNSGKAAASPDRKNVFAAIAEAPYVENVSMR